MTTEELKRELPITVEGLKTFLERLSRGTVPGVLHVTKEYQDLILECIAAKEALDWFEKEADFLVCESACVWVTRVAYDLTEIGRGPL